jgi:predicted esterase
MNRPGPNRTLVLVAFLLVLAPAAALARGGRYNPRMHKPEFRFVDSTDEEEAEELLEKLLRTYKDERKAARLVKLLKKGRPFAGGLAKSDTVDWPCADGLTRQFTYYLPSRYSPKRPCGVLVFLHGAIRQPPPGGGAHEAKTFGRAVDDLDFITIGPSTYEGHEWGEPAVRQMVHEALDHVKQRFNVDEDRVYLAGDSDGGRGTYAIPETEATFYAAAIPVIGSPGGVTRFVNLRNLPWFAINGENDSIFKIDNVRAAVENMRKMGFDLTWKLVEGGQHDPFFFVKYEKEVCEFIRKHVRDPLPPIVDWQVDPEKTGYGAGFPSNTFRWIRIEECGQTSSQGTFEDAGGWIRPSYARVRAERKEGNRIEVTTRSVKAFSVLVHDEMLDLEKEVEVHVNGKLAYRGIVVPDARVILEEARRFNDRRLVFSNRLRIDVDAPPVRED